MFPRITKCFGYRWTFRLAVLVFAATFVLLPFSNQITGPVPGSNDTFSGSGSGSGLWNNTDYCGNDLNSMNVSVNENSVKRIPVYIWAAVIGIFVFVVVSRYTVVCMYIGQLRGVYSSLCKQAGESHPNFSSISNWRDIDHRNASKSPYIY